MNNQPPTTTSSQASDSVPAPSQPWMKTGPFAGVSACQGFSSCFLPSVISFHAVIICPHVTACGQMIAGGHSQALPPAAFRINIPVMAMRIPGSYPHRMGTRRLFPPARLPVICVAVIAVIPTYPDMFAAWAGGAMLMDPNRGPKSYDDLSISRYPKRKAKQRRKNQFSHFLLLRLDKQVYGRYRFSIPTTERIDHMSGAQLKELKDAYPATPSYFLTMLHDIEKGRIPLARNPPWRPSEE
jgi:hypothetical protein